MKLDTRCCIVGGGPAGMVLGWLLARAGVDVIVLEKHADFFRDFRGDTIHPSTLELMYELGVLDDFLRVPHTQMDHLDLELLGERVPGPEFAHIPTHCKFLALMPQWDFLDFVRKQANQYASFQLILEAEAIDLVGTGHHTSGVIAKTPRGRLEIAADLVVACDGRSSILRDRAQLPRKDLGAPIDVLWMRLPRRASDGDQVLATITNDKFLVMLDRGEYWQCAFLIEKGGLDDLKRHGLDAFRDDIARLVPMLADRVGTLDSWEDVKLLTVVVDRLERWWQRGLLCIGDAAHAMSPVGGVGINLAIQDAVAAANQLALPLREHRVTDDDLEAVQARREPPARRIQRLQMMIHDRVLAKVLVGRGQRVLEIGRFLLRHAGPVRRAMAKTIGVGQLEHVRSPDDGVRRPKLPPSTSAKPAGSSSKAIRSH